MIFEKIYQTPNSLKSLKSGVNFQIFGGIRELRSEASIFFTPVPLKPVQVRTISNSISVLPVPLSSILIDSESGSRLRILETLDYIRFFNVTLSPIGSTLGSVVLILTALVFLKLN